MEDRSLSFRELLLTEDPERHIKWLKLQEKITKDFHRESIDIQGILFLIGVQELGKGPRIFSKREKEDLIHIALCKLFSQEGYYDLLGVDQDGWPHWEQVKTMSFVSSAEQEAGIKRLILLYFEQIGYL